MVAKGYSSSFHNLEIGNCREAMRKNRDPYDYHSEQALLAGGKCIPLSWRGDGDPASMIQWQVPHQTGPSSEQKLALFETFSQKFHFAAI